MIKKKLWLLSEKKSRGNSYLNVENNGFNPVENVSRRGQKLFGQGPKLFKKLKVFKKNQSSSECYYGYVECIFHNFSDGFLLKGQKSFAQNP